jgi:hypothetical protein
VLGQAASSGAAAAATASSGATAATASSGAAASADAFHSAYSVLGVVAAASVPVIAPACCAVYVDSSVLTLYQYGFPSSSAYSTHSCCSI